MIIILLQNFHYYFSLIVCLLLIIFLIIKKFNFKFNAIKLSILILSLFFLQSIFLSYFQYLAFKEHPISKYLLPPYQPLSYFIFYSLYHYFSDFYFRILGGIINLLTVIVLNFLFKKTLFYDDEYRIVFLSSILINFPFNLLIIPLNLLLIFFIHFKNFLFQKQFILEKISTKNYWLFICFFLIIINIIFINDENLKQILFNFKP